MKKILFAFIALFQISALTLLPLYSVSAGLFGSTPNARGIILDFLINDLLFDENDLAVGQGSQKILIPEVTVTFTKIDETHYKATANPAGITNPDQAYYTWYIRNAGEDGIYGNDDDFNRLDRDTGTLPLADHLGSVIDEIDGWKIAATREMIRYYFDPMRYDSTFNGGNGDNIIQDAEYAAETDEDGYKAVLGGDNARDGDNGTNYCYVYDRSSGELYELVEGGTLDGVDCPDGYEPVCAENSAEELTCPVDVPEISGGGSASSGGDTGASASVSISGGGGPRFEKITACMSNGDRPICAEDLIVTDSITPTCATGKPYCKAISYDMGNINAEAPLCPEISGGTEPLCSTLEGDGILAPIQGCTNATINIPRKGEGFTNSDLENLCKSGEGSAESIHLFPLAPNTPLANDLGRTIGGSDATFDIEDELFWGMDPTNDTTVLDFGDEEFITGRGVSEFIWEYHPGDEIGVVIEGLGQPTRHDDHSSQKAFAFMPEGCTPRGLGGYLEEIRGKLVEIPTAEMRRDDLNACLRNNFIAPGGQKEELSLIVSLSGPGELVPKRENDTIAFQADLSHPTEDLNIPTNRSNTDFEWFIEHSTSFTQNGPFIAETDPDVLRDTFNLRTMQGLQLDKLQFLSNFPDEWFDDDGRGWVRVRVRANAPSTQQDITRFGQTVYTFQITKTDHEITAYVASPNAEATAYEKNLHICTSDEEKILCPVVRNQVIALKLPDAISARNTLWEVNGQTVRCDGSISTDCIDPDDPAIIYIPISADVDLYEITATISELGHATKPTSTASYRLATVDPSMQIVPIAGADYKIRGEYQDVDGETFTDTSTDLMIAQRDSSITLAATFIPSFIAEDLTLAWTVSGETYGSGTEISFVPVNTAVVSAKARYDISDLQRQALRNVFGISTLTSSRHFFAQNATVIIEENPELANTPTQQFFATVAQNAPSYILFLLKIIFTVGIMLFSASLVLSFGSRKQ